MNIVILSRGEHLYSTRRLVSVAQARGHRVEVFDPVTLSLVVGGDAPLVTVRGRALDDIDVVIPRIGWMATAYGLATVKHFQMMGVTVVNSVLAITRARDKLRCLQLLSRSRLPVPRTVMTRSPDDLHHAIEVVGGPPVVLKFLAGAQGVGVMLVESQQSAESVLEALWGIDENVLVQEYIAEAAGHDQRFFVVGGAVVAAMKRQARDGDFRSNLHRGGWGEALEPKGAEVEIALRTAAAIEIEVAGVDILLARRGPLVMEVNASPGLEGIELATGCDLASSIVEYAERKHEARRLAGR
ncbi:MAG: 30S ribosomal protein S6--L-glutamate ligase [Planctomycetota bacterium]